MCTIHLGARIKVAKLLTRIKQQVEICVIKFRSNIKNLTYFILDLSGRINLGSYWST